MQIRFIIILLLFTNMVYPCAVCYGNPEDPMAQGMNMGILTLMGFIGFVLIMVLSTIISISLKTKKINNSKG